MQIRWMWDGAGGRMGRIEMVSREIRKIDLYCAT